MPIGDSVRTLLGKLTDFVTVPYTFGVNTILAHLNTAYYHIHGQAFVYPDLADNVLLTAGTGTWDNTGTITEIVPASTLTVSAFDLHWLNISDISGIGTVQIDIYAGDPGSEIKIGATRANRSTNQSRNGPNRIQIPQQSPGTRISARLSDSTTGSLTCLVSFEGHFYAS